MAFDVIIAGAGPSGIMAAIAAARNGSKVLLIDKNGYPGGSNTAAMVCPLMTFHSGDRQIVKGIAEELIQRLKKRGATLYHLKDPIGQTSTITPIEPVILRCVYMEMLHEEKNITLLLNTMVIDVKRKKNRIDKIIVANKSGITEYVGNYFIDATGDGDLAYLSKVKFELGRPQDHLTQPLTLIFKVGGVDFDKIIDYVENNPEQFVLENDADMHQYLAISGFFDIVQEAKESGDFPLPRDRVLFFQGVNKGEIFVNSTRVIRKSGIDATAITEATVEAFTQIEALMKFFKKSLPGFENAYLVEIADQIGVRESRRIEGKRVLTLDYVMNENSDDESVAVCAYPVDIHDPNGSDLIWIRTKQYFCYDIPYGVMIPKKIDNLIVTGRCISSEHEALASVRISATVMAMGQAAGTAAALCLKHNCNFEDLPIKELQDLLRKQGAVVSKKDLSD